MISFAFCSLFVIISEEVETKSLNKAVFVKCHNCENFSCGDFVYNMKWPVVCHKVGVIHPPQIMTLSISFLKDGFCFPLYGNFTTNFLMGSYFSYKLRQ